MSEERDIDLGFTVNRVGRIARSAKTGTDASSSAPPIWRSVDRPLSSFGGEVREPLILVQGDRGVAARGECVFQVSVSRHGVQLHTRSYRQIREALYYATVMCLLSGVSTLVVDVRNVDSHSLAEDTDMISGGREQRRLERELRVGPSYQGGVIAWHVRALDDPEHTPRVLRHLQASYGISNHESVFEEVIYG